MAARKVGLRQASNRTALIPVIAGASGAVVGFTIHAIAGPDSARIPAEVQVALIGLCGGLLGAVAGAAIGAMSGSRVAAGAERAARLTSEQAAADAAAARRDARDAQERELRQRERESVAAREAEDARLREAQTFAARIALFRTLDAVAEERSNQITNQLAARQYGAKSDADLPRVDPIGDVRAAAQDLFRLCDQVTVERGWAVWSALHALATLAYDAARDSQKDGSIAPLTKEQVQEYHTKSRALRKARFALVQEARREQGLAVLEPRPDWFADPVDNEANGSASHLGDS